MAEQRIEEKKKNSAVEAEEDEAEKKKQNENVDPELFSCLLQPVTADSDPEYISIRRFLLFRKADSGILRRRVSTLFLSSPFPANLPHTFISSVFN